MRESRTFAGQLLLLVADFVDLHRVACSVPRAMRAMNGDPGWRKERRWVEALLDSGRARRKLQKTFSGLRAAGYLRRTGRDARGYFLTPKGREKALQLRIGQTRRRKFPAHQLLMVFYDIPERQRRERDLLRRMLQSLGFTQLQRSIWVAPYDVTREMRWFIRNYQLTRDVRLLRVRELAVRSSAYPRAEVPLGASKDVQKIYDREK